MPFGRLPGPLGLTDRSGHVDSFTAPLGLNHLNLSASSTDELTLTAFRKEVLAAAIADRVRKGRKYFPPIPEAEVTTVEGGHRLRKEVAQSFVQLITAARTDLRIEPTGPASDDDGRSRLRLARAVTAIGLGSGYRDYARESSIWNGLFATYYEETRSKRQSADGGPHGEAAVNILVPYYSSRKAPPGFSNHSDGRAVDFTTTQNGVQYGPYTRQRKAWRATWLHQWLLVNAKRFGFHPLASEEWHWDHR